MKLTVNVAAYCDGGIDRDDIALFDQQFSRLVAELSDLGFRDRATGAKLGDSSGSDQHMQ